MSHTKYYIRKSFSKLLTLSDISIYDADMPHVSRQRLKKTTEEELVSSLQTILTKITSTVEMDAFLLSLLSPTEKLMLAKRLAIIIMTEEGISDSTISQALHVTRETVARIKMKSELRGEGYQIAFKKLHKAKDLQEFKAILLSLARYSVRAAGGYVKPTILD